MKLFKRFKSRKGQSLAEFAVTTAMMATLATTAAPKFSGVGEGAKEKKTTADIDKIMKSANNFFNEKVTSEGRGRFPGQIKYNRSVPDDAGYTTIDELEAALTTFVTFESAEANKWASIFGTQNPDGTVDGEARKASQREVLREHPEQHVTALEHKQYASRDKKYGYFDFNNLKI